MLQSIASQLSEADAQLIEAYQLGTPLSIYRLKPGLLLLLHSIGFIITGCGIVQFVLAIIIVFTRWNQEQPLGYILFSILVILTILCLVMGLTILRVTVPGARKKRVVVCEQGLFQSGKNLGSKEVAVARWSDILAIKRFFNEYFIMCQGNRVIKFETTYQNIDELVALVKTHSGKA